MTGLLVLAGIAIVTIYYLFAFWLAGRIDNGYVSMFVWLMLALGVPAALAVGVLS